MIKEITIRNYKSIYDLTMELGHVNVLIGENGCGKTNILEAVAMFSAAILQNTDATTLFSKGVRVTKPGLTLSSFFGEKPSKHIEIEARFNNASRSMRSFLFAVDAEDIFTNWKDDSERRDQKMQEDGLWDTDWGKALKELRSGLELVKGNPDLIGKEELNEIKTQLSSILEEAKKRLSSSKNFPLPHYIIFNLDNQALRGISNESKIQPLGINGEGLDLLLSDFSESEWEELLSFGHLISWLDKIIIDKKDNLKFKGHKLGRSNSILYFRDKFMRKNNNVFAAENSNEGILHILFYLALFISKKTPKFFAIDNIETALNPKLCRTLMKEIAALAVKHDKQVLITTHNPAILDGMNLHDDTQHLFEIARNDEGHTRARRIKLKPEAQGKDLKLSEMWMRGYLGALPDF